MDHDLSGRVLGGRFELISPLGEGGYGAVYLARQISMDRQVAIKVIHPRVAQASDFAERFMREARVASKLQHPNTVVYFDFGRDGAILFLAMELVKGRSLGDVIAEEGPLSVIRTAHMAKQICGALAEAHGQGMVHRDLKPANILLTERGGDPDFVKVIDFGLAKIVQGDLDKSSQDLTSEGVLLGTPSYMAPEQIRGQALDGRCDVYALGVILFVMLTGRKPYDGDTPLGTAVLHLTEAIPRLREHNPRLPAEVDELVYRCMAKDPSERPPTVQALAGEMDTWLGGLGPTRSGSMYATDVMPKVGAADIEVAAASGRFAPPHHTQTLDPTPSSGKRLRLASIDGPSGRPSDRTLQRGDAPEVPRASRGLLLAGAGAVLLAAVVAVVAVMQGKTETPPEAGPPSAERSSAEAEPTPALSAAQPASAPREMRGPSPTEHAAEQTASAVRMARLAAQLVWSARSAPPLGPAPLGQPMATAAVAELQQTPPPQDEPAQAAPVRSERRRTRTSEAERSTPTEVAPAEVSRGMLRITAQPWGTVWCDGERLGDTPIDREVPAGTYDCRIVSPEGLEAQRTIEVPAGAGELVQVRFDR